MRAATGKRFTKIEQHQIVAQALLHLRDIPWLSDSPLVDFPEVQRRCQGSPKLFAEGQALASYLQELAEAIVARLDGEGKVGIIREVLEGVLAGKSISQIAKQHGKTREHFSRTYWALAVQLVIEEIQALKRKGSLSYNTLKVRKPSA